MLYGMCRGLGLTDHHCNAPRWKFSYMECGHYSSFLNVTCFSPHFWLSKLCKYAKSNPKSYFTIYPKPYTFIVLFKKKMESLLPFLVDSINASLVQSLGHQLFLYRY